MGNRGDDVCVLSAYTPTAEGRHHAPAAHRYWNQARPPQRAMELSAREDMADSRDSSCSPHQGLTVAIRPRAQMALGREDLLRTIWAVLTPGCDDDTAPRDELASLRRRHEDFQGIWGHLREGCQQHCWVFDHELVIAGSVHLDLDALSLIVKGHRHRPNGELFLEWRIERGQIVWVVD